MRRPTPKRPAVRHQTDPPRPLDPPPPPPPIRTQVPTPMTMVAPHSDQPIVSIAKMKGGEINWSLQLPGPDLSASISRVLAEARTLQATLDDWQLERQALMDQWREERKAKRLQEKAASKAETQGDANSDSAPPKRPRGRPRKWPQELQARQAVNNPPPAPLNREALRDQIEQAELEIERLRAQAGLR